MSQTGSELFTLTNDVILHSGSAGVLLASQHEPLTIVSSSEGSRALFDASEMSREICVLNILGQTLCSQTVAPGATWTDFAKLPRGCYFARMGNETAKFVVME